jgi:hypothetical protein
MAGARGQFENPKEGERLLLQAVIRQLVRRKQTEKTKYVM